jgi:hypothetical protein
MSEVSIFKYRKVKTSFKSPKLAWRVKRKISINQIIQILCYYEMAWETQGKASPSPYPDLRSGRQGQGYLMCNPIIENLYYGIRWTCIYILGLYLTN